jgi:hypothetical protein
VKFFKDGNGSLCVEWEQAKGHYKRAWIQHKTEWDKDWAESPGGRYLNVVRCDNKTRNPGGNPTDFPVFCDLSDEQILTAFVATVCAITGCKLPAQLSNPDTT